MLIRINHLGKRFGKLVVVSLESTGSHTYWKCICDCGKEKIAESYCLQAGRTTHCGCDKRISKQRIKILPGDKFGLLSVIEEVEAVRLPSGQVNRMIKCACECGTIKNVRFLHLIRARTNSCGCLQGEKHGFGKTKLYGVWQSMKQRCYAGYSNCKRYYQEKGIEVCEEWRNSFVAFKAWAINNGYKIGLQIDRIDNAGNYQPSNCRWVTQYENMMNRDITRCITIDGVKKPIAVFVREQGITKNVELICKRIASGWPIDKALSLPPDKNQRIKARSQDIKLSKFNLKTTNA